MACFQRQHAIVGSPHSANALSRRVQDRKRVERARIMAALQDQREGEAAGTVYCFGMGYGQEYQSHDRPFLRNNLTIMSKLSGKGVHQVEAVRCSCGLRSTLVVLTLPHPCVSMQGFDSTLAYAVCENGDVWVWGEVRPDEAAPVGFRRPLVYDANIKERATLFRTDYRFKRPRLAGNDLVGTSPKGQKPYVLATATAADRHQLLLEAHHMPPQAPQQSPQAAQARDW